MLMWLALVLRAEAVHLTVTGEAVGLAEEDREDIKLLVMIYYILEMCNNKPNCAVLKRILTFEVRIFYSPNKMEVEKCKHIV